jgi:hypothetical protein
MIKRFGFGIVCDSLSLGKHLRVAAGSAQSQRRGRHDRTRQKEDFDKVLPAFKELVGSYFFVKELSSPN